MNCPKCGSDNINNEYCNDCFWCHTPSKLGRKEHKNKAKQCKICGAEPYPTKGLCKEHLLEYNNLHRKASICPARKDGNYSVPIYYATKFGRSPRD